ncbi:MAG: hypothetical protein COB02_06475 [Candidatus Cloacimonadota bacterium]|nr:MAG: hypothetical protein COB02_06475 [Candidatus Cloacimonadota bacterium]
MILQLQNIALSFSTELISIKNFSFEEGLHCIWGVSGSGKTSFLKMLSGRAYGSDLKGIFLVDSNSYTLSSEQDMALYNQKYISAMYQDSFLIDDFNVLENLLLPFYLEKQNFDKIKYDQLIKALEIEHLVKKEIHQISRGEAQRVRLARSLLFAQKILILDEPLVYLDKKMKSICFDLICQTIKNKKLIAFFSTHDQSLKESKEFSFILNFDDGLHL